MVHSGQQEERSHPEAGPAAAAVSAGPPHSGPASAHPGLAEQCVRAKLLQSCLIRPCLLNQTYFEQISINLAGFNRKEKEMATHFSILAWKIPWTEKPGQATVHGVAKSWTRLK